ncbi:hypothetical protein D3C78_1971890 [compost metagenome]
MPVGLCRIKLQLLNEHGTLLYVDDVFNIIDTILLTHQEADCPVRPLSALLLNLIDISCGTIPKS